jgi:hypothetical protein
VLCNFDPTSPRISAFEIHEWIHDQLRVPEKSMTMIQIDGPKRQVYIKLVEIAYVQALLQSTNGQSKYKHVDGEISIVRIEMAGMSTRRVRIANVPPEIDDGMLRSALSQ